jgi:uncharacterized coiled-coil protein SlyX
MANEERNNDLESRVSRLEGVVDQINLRLADIQARMNSMETRMNSRMNTQIGLTVAMWATITGILLAMLLKS